MNIVLYYTKYVVALGLHGLLGLRGVFGPRATSLGPLGLRVTGFLGSWVFGHLGAWDLRALGLFGI
jgi:hypothetical protein